MKNIRAFWLSLSIRFKLLIYFFGIIFFVSVFNLYLNNSNYNMMDQFNDTMTNYYKINELLNLTQINRDAIDKYIRELDDNHLKTFNESKEDIDLLIDELYDRFSSQEAYFSLNAISNSVNSYMPLWIESIEQRENNVSTYYESYYAGTDIHEYTKNYIEELLYTSFREGRILYNTQVEEANLMRQISILLIAGVFSLALIFGALFSNYLVKPIKKLAESSTEMANGNLDIDAVDIQTDDEVGVLADSFNSMSESIRDYVEDLKQKVIIEKKLHEEELAIIKMEQLLKESEFQALQSQINPHFLFNTLNTIARTAMFEDANDTVKLIQALSNLFRYRMKNVGDTVTLEEELWLINEYIYLQKMRFKERLEFRLEYEGDLSTIMIPVFTIQPLVENAIIHGIEPKIEGGVVRVRIKDKTDRYIISIIDTGNGMSKERVDTIMDQTVNNKSDRIGVSNVFNRFKLHFGDRGHFNIRSHEGIGTMIRMIIWKEADHV